MQARAYPEQIPEGEEGCRITAKQLTESHTEFEGIVGKEKRKTLEEELNSVIGPKCIHTFALRSGDSSYPYNTIQIFINILHNL